MVRFFAQALFYVAALLFFLKDVRAAATLPGCASLFAPTATAAAADAQSPVTPRARLVVVSAPSGGGKTTLAQAVLKQFPSLVPSISYTTRAPRGQEQNGVDYHFLSREQFEAKIKANGFAEWAEVHGNYYGTSRELIESNLQAGRSVLLLIDVKGADVMRKAFGDKVFSIFVVPPDLATLEARLRARGTDSNEAIALRLKNAETEMREAPRFDHVLVNDELPRATAELQKLIVDQGLAP